MRCGIYIRVFNDKEEEQKQLISAQKDLFITYATEKGWDIYDFYIDFQSGATSNRKELQRFLADAKAKNFDVMMTKEFSRLARNSRLSMEIFDTVLQYNTHIITLDKAINTFEENNSMLELIDRLGFDNYHHTKVNTATSLRERAVIS